MMDLMEVALAQKGYTVASVEFQRAVDAENRLLKGELVSSSEQPYLLPNSEHLSPLEVARRQTSEKLCSFNRAAAIYRKSRG